MAEKNEKIDELMSKYRQLSREIQNCIGTIHREIDNGTITDISVKTMIKLDKDRVDFFNVCKELEKYSYFTVELDDEIKNRKKTYVEEILKIKKSLVFFYNMRVYNFSKRIDKVRNACLNNLELLSEIDKLEIPKMYNREVTNCQDVVSLDFNILDNFDEKLNDFESRLAVEKSGSKEIDELKYINEYLIHRINDLIDNFGNVKRITKKNIELDIRLCLTRLNLIKRKAIQNKEIYDRINMINMQIVLLRKKLKNKKANKQVKQKNKDYYDLKDKIYELYNDVEDYYSSLDDKIDITEVRQITVDSEKFRKLLEDYFSSVKAKYKEDNLLYENLVKYLDMVKRSIDKIDGRIKEIQKYNYFSLYDVLDKDIPLIEKRITKLDDKINSFDKVIKNQDRGKINSVISDINLEISRIEEYLKLNTNVDKSREENLRNKLANLKQKMKDCEKKYRSKCPLMVKQMKSAGSLFKKYDKKVLIVSALSSAALFNTVVGPFVIPVIIFGNMLLIHKFPILNKYNKILGDSIGAKKNDDGEWILNSGVKINPITSLLKSIAVNGFGVPSVIKELINKVKELSIRVNEYLNKKKNDIVDKFSEIRDNSAQDFIELKARLLYYRYIKVRDEKSIEEFCKDEGLSDEIISKFKLYVEFRDAEIKGDIKGRSRVHD